MEKTPILPADVFTVVNKTILFDHDRKLLTMLYQPIIGSISINLYFTLWSYLDKSELFSHHYTHHHLMSSMQLNLSEIVSSREKLEAIGLLKTYIKNGDVNSYVYEMYSPISADEFLSNPILSTTLYNNIGKEEYKKIIEYFKIPKLSMTGYKNITLPFHDVFEVHSLINLSGDLELKKVRQLGISFIPTIDLNTVFTLIPRELLNYNGVTKEMRELVCKLAFIYNFDEQILSEIIANSIDEKHSIDSKVLQDNARKYYKFENGNRLPSIIYRNQPEYLRNKTSDDSKKAKMIYAFETTSPYEFLCSKNGGSKPTSSDVGILSFLLVDMNLTPGVVNVLIDYVLKINQNKLIKGFVETIASQWKRSNIETVVDAMKIAEDEYKSRKKVTSKKMVKTESKPEWFDKNIVEDIASDEEQAEFLKKLRKVG